MSKKLLANRYELIEKIGEGGMALVYKGRDTLLNRFVAIKILKPEFTKNEKFVDNFVKESQAAAKLTNQNIVGVYDVGNEGHIHYIVMELVSGKTLSSIIEEKGKLDYLEAIDIAKQILNGLSEAHDNHVIHRDVKPHNIIITENGVAKLADFGIARVVSQESIEEGDEEVMGSVHYFSPEQARGSYIDERSDIYSLGIVLYEMLTGEVPFDGDSAVAVALKHINEPMPRILDKDPSLPPKLAKIIEIATSKFQNSRYASAKEMIKDLESVEYVASIMGNKAFGLDKKESEIDEEKNDIKKKTKIISRVEKLEKEKTKKKESFEKKTNKLAIAAICFLVVILFVVISIFSGWFVKDKEIEVPQFVGKTFEEATLEASKYNITLEREDVYSSSQEIGLIDSQNPSYSTKIKEGSVVTVYVSKGKKNNVVPNLIGSTKDEADKLLTSNGFSLGEVTYAESSKEKGTVIDQSIDAGSSYKSGSSIDIVLSSGGGDNFVEMVYLIGKSYDVAKSELSEMGLNIGNITYEEVESGQSNIVTWQSIKPGYDVKKGDTIDLKLTKVKETVEDEQDNNEEGN